MGKFFFSSGMWNAGKRRFHIVLAAFILSLIVSYAFAFPFFIRVLGPATRLFCMIFLIPAALFWGIRGGSVIFAIALALGIFLHHVFDIKYEGGIIGPAMGFLAIVTVGRLSDLSRQLGIKIDEVSAMRDALEISEKKYRKLFEMESDAVFLAETETGRILEANRAAQEMFQYSREELLRMTGMDLSQNPEKTVAKLKNREEKAQLVYGRRKNRSTFPAEASARHFDFHGRRVSIVAIRDITLRKSAEEEKSRLEKKLLQAQRMEAIGTLAGGIAHDFNNILGAIVGYTDLIRGQGGHLSNQQLFYLERVLGASNRARELVEQILTFSRQSEKRKCAIKVKPVVQEALKLLRASIPATIDIRKSLKAEKDTIVADSTQIYQIIINLCTNSAQAMTAEKGTIEVALTNRELDEEFVLLHPEVEPGPHLEISVRDTGRGMEQEILDRIFEPYFTTKEKYKGTGLGLSVVHGIVMHNHGCILVESIPGNGTIFRIYFPLTTVDSEVVKKQQAHAPGGTESILVVDDDEILSEMTAEMLQALGYRVEQRVNSVEALNFFKAKPYAIDLVITDMTMPVMSGAELCREISRINPKIPLIICTGYSDLMDETKAKTIGANKLLMKPVSLQDLAVTVREALDSRREKTIV